MSALPPQAKVAMSASYVMDLLQSKKFRVIALLIALWSTPVHTFLSIDVKAMPWITCAISAFILAQGVRDAASCFRGKCPESSDEA